MNWWTNWKARHRHPMSIGLHVVGIPLTIAAVVLAIMQLWGWRWDLWWRPLVLVVGGYLLQWLGHRLEGNTMGEIILIRRRFGQPYTTIAPRYQDQPEDFQTDHS